MAMAMAMTTAIQIKIAIKPSMITIIIYCEKDPLVVDLFW